MKLSKIIYMAIGSVMLGLGALGAVLPVLPTVPFLMAAAFCFARSSQRMDAWFKSTKLYRNNLESFAQGRGMTQKAKIRVMVTVSFLMMIGFAFMRNALIGRISLLVVWAVHMITFCFIVKTCPAAEQQENGETDSSNQL